MPDSDDNRRACPRDPGLDLARSLAVTAMVFGHTLAATLRAEDLDLPVIQTYWQLRGLTAPLFLVVSGWVVALLFCRRPRPGLGHARERLPRVLTLLALGLILRFPTWDFHGLLAGKPTVLAHFFALDALQLIGLCLLAGSLLFGVSRDPRVRAGLALAAAATVALAAPAVWSATADANPWAALFLGNGSSPFPLFPWSAYFLAGLGLGALSVLTTQRRRWAFAVILGGVVLATGAAVTTWTWATPSPWLTARRLGQVLVIVGVLGLAPAAWGRNLAFLGRHTLAIYFIHMILVYGGLRTQGLHHHVGPTLSLGGSMGLSTVVLTVSTGCALIWNEFRRRGRPWLESRLKSKTIRVIFRHRKSD
ncbi:MAG: acyltransferase [bacterium]|nr:acyltransferase [bacterium]